MNKYKLGDISEIQSGPFGTQLHKDEYVLEGIPMLNSKNIGNGIVVEDSLDFVPEAVCERLPRYVLKKGDILFGRAGTIERHTYVDSKYDGCFQGTNCIRIRCKDKQKSRYISYYLWLNKLKVKIENAAGGSIQSYITTDLLKDIEVEIPDDYEKRANFLSLIDEKIHNNNQINDNLEQQILSIYHYLFTQFDFPDEVGKPYCSSGGKMLQNDILKRNIPITWKVKTLGELCSFQNGINYDKGIIGDKDYRIINVRNISSSSILLDENELDIISLPHKKGDKYCVTDDSIIIARSGIPGATRILFKPTTNTIFCGFIICCTPTDKELQYYLTFYLKLLEGSSATQTGGSILQNVSQDTLSSLPVPIPPKMLLDEFNQTVLQTFELIHTNMNETSQLINLRDWLLPMLMNGQATISD